MARGHARRAITAAVVTSPSDTADEEQAAFMGVEEVLESLGLSMYASAFEEEGLDDMETICEMTVAQMDELIRRVGFKFGHGVKFCQAIRGDEQDLKNDEATTESAEPAALAMPPLDLAIKHAAKCFCYTVLLLFVVSLILGGLLRTWLVGYPQMPVAITQGEETVILGHKGPQDEPGKELTYYYRSGQPYVAVTLMHAAIVLGMLVPLMFVRLCSKHWQELLSFGIWFSLVAILVSDMFNMAVADQPATEFMRQVLDRTNEPFLWGGFKFTFSDIGHADDFYRWMRTSIGSLLFAGQVNQMATGPGVNMPGMDVARQRTDGGVPWRGVSVVVPWSCNLRQLRMKPVRCAFLADQWCIDRYHEDAEETVARGLYENETSGLDEEVVEKWVPHQFLNSDGAVITPFYYTGSISRIQYPGEGGFAPGVTRVPWNDGQMLMRSESWPESHKDASGEWPSMWASCGAFRGYAPLSKPSKDGDNSKPTAKGPGKGPGKGSGSKPAKGDGSGRRAPKENHGKALDIKCDPRIDNKTGEFVYSVETFIKDVDKLEKSRWIDGRTSLVHLTCKFINHNINMNATVRYGIEFVNSGVARPQPPFITVNRARGENFGAPQFDEIQTVLIFGLWAFTSELLMDTYDDNLPDHHFGHGISRTGWKWYLPTLPFLTMSLFTDLATMVVSMVAYYWLQATRWYRPSPAHREFEPCIFSEADSYNNLQFTYGLLTLFFSLRVVFMCDSVPHLNVIGRTLAKSFQAFVMFIIVFTIIMLGFSVFFFMIYTSQIQEFHSVGASFFTLFRGMLGDIPLDEMVAARPMITPFVFTAFCIITLFTIFTILIAIISDAYAAVLSDEEGHTLDEDDAGAIAQMVRAIGTFTGHYMPHTKHQHEPTLLDWWWPTKSDESEEGPAIEMASCSASEVDPQHQGTSGAGISVVGSASNLHRQHAQDCVDETLKVGV